MSRFKLVPVCCDGSGTIRKAETRQSVDLRDDGTAVDIGRGNFNIRHPCISRQAIRIAKLPDDENCQIQVVKGKVSVFHSAVDKGGRAHLKDRKIIWEGQSALMKWGDILEFVQIEEIPADLYKNDQMRQLGELARDPHRYILTDEKKNNFSDLDDSTTEQKLRNITNQPKAQYQPKHTALPPAVPKIHQKSSPQDIAEWILNTILQNLPQERASALSDVIHQEEIDGDALMALACSSDFASDFRDFVQLISSQLPAPLGFGQSIKLKRAIQALGRDSDNESTTEHDLKVGAVTSDIEPPNDPPSKTSLHTTDADKKSKVSEQSDMFMHESGRRDGEKPLSSTDAGSAKPDPNSSKSTADMDKDCDDAQISAQSPMAKPRALDVQSLMESPPTIQRSRPEEAQSSALTNQRCEDTMDVSHVIITGSEVDSDENQQQPSSTGHHKRPRSAEGNDANVSAKRRPRKRSISACKLLRQRLSSTSPCEAMDRGAEADTESETEDESNIKKPADVPTCILLSEDEAPAHTPSKARHTCAQAVSKQPESACQRMQGPSSESIWCGDSKTSRERTTGQPPQADVLLPNDVKAKPSKSMHAYKPATSDSDDQNHSEDDEIGAESDVQMHSANKEGDECSHFDDGVTDDDNHASDVDATQAVEGAICASSANISTELDGMFASESLPEVDVLPNALTIKLQPHQMQALGWMLDAEARQSGAGKLPRGGILADDQGFGKTITVLALLVHSLDQEAKKPSLIGKKIKRKFMAGDFIGTITAHDPTSGYRVVYTDGDQEDIDEEEILPLLIEKPGKGIYRMCTCGSEASVGSRGTIRCNACASLYHLSCASKDAERLEKIADLKDCSFVCHRCSEKATCTKPISAPYTTLVVAPTSVLTQWQEELESKSKGRLRVFLYHGKNKTHGPGELTTYNVIITSYDVLKKEVPAEGVKGSGVPSEGGGPLYKVQWRRVVLDEAHEIRSTTSKRFRACEWLGATAYWCLTGTPIVNDLADLNAYCRFIAGGEQGWLPARMKELTRGKKKKQGAENYRKVQELLSPLLLRRTKRTLRNGKPIVQLPQRVVTLNTEIRFSPREEELYHRLASGAREEFLRMVKKGWRKNVIHIFALLMRLRQFCNHPCLLPEDTLRVIADDTVADADGGMAGDGPMPASQHAQRQRSANLQRSVSKAFLSLQDEPGVSSAATQQAEEDDDAATLSEVDEEMLRRVEEEGVSSGGLFTGPSAKQKAILAEVERLLSQDRACKILIFAQLPTFFTLLGPDLKRAGHGYLEVTGKMSVSQRTHAIDRFRADPAVRVLMLSAKAGCLGLNLSVASRVILVDPWWNSACDDQAIDRAHRLGQARDVHVTKFVVPGTVEENMLRLQQYKDGIARRLLNESGGCAAAAAAAACRPTSFTLREYNILFGVEAAGKGAKQAAARRQNTAAVACGGAAAGAAAAASASGGQQAGRRVGTAAVAGGGAAAAAAGPSSSSQEQMGSAATALLALSSPHARP